MSVAAQLMRNVVVRPRTRCWVWTAAQGWLGYGRVRLSKPRRYLLAHRASYETFVGPIPDGMVVMHRCDRPSCINPDHLTLGTQSDNIKDCSNKGRLVNNKGENHGMSRLTSEQVLLIRASGGRPCDLSRQYGVNEATIRAVLSRKNWRHL